MAGAHVNPTGRFSSRVENYVKYRPSYPPDVVQLLAEECGLGPSAQVADVGSGTGILTRLLLETGATVYAVEPNAEMRAAGEALLAGRPGFHSVNATAEQTGLPSGSVDLIVAAQAFHWFDPPAARQEFARILKPGGYVALIWNDRHVDTTPFLRAYEEVLAQYGTDYAEVKHRNVQPATHEAFFGPGGYVKATFANAQLFDWDGFLGRVLSSSYAPEPGHPLYGKMESALRGIYEKFAVDGKVSFDYTTEVFYGRLS